jgi:hypothetical protein
VIRQVASSCGNYRRSATQARPSRAVLGVTALLALLGAGCAAEPEPAGPARIRYGPVPATVFYVEEAADVAFAEMPTIWHATPSQIRAMPEPDDDQPSPDRWILEDPGSRAALGLASERPTRSIASRLAYYDTRSNEIIFVRAPDNGVEADVLVHELTHALTRQIDPIDADEIHSSDQDVAMWMMNEGVATALQRQWAEAYPSDRSGTTRASRSTWGLSSLGYEAGTYRARLEFGQLEPSDDWTTAAHRVATAAGVLDPRLPLSWAPLPVEEPTLPDGAELDRRDRLGMFGWLEVLAQSSATDQAAVLGWRGESTLSYRSADGQDCVVSGITTTDSDAAQRLASELALALPRATAVATASEIELRACAVPGQATPRPSETDVEPLLAYLAATFWMLRDGVGPDHVAVDPITAVCIAEQVHHDVGWIEAIRTWDEETGQANEAAAMARCLADLTDASD